LNDSDRAPTTAITAVIASWSTDRGDVVVVGDVIDDVVVVGDVIDDAFDAGVDVISRCIVCILMKCGRPAGGARCGSGTRLPNYTKKINTVMAR